MPGRRISDLVDLNSLDLARAVGEWGGESVTQYRRLQQRTCAVLDAEGTDTVVRVISVFLQILILLNVLAVMLETVEDVRSLNPMLFRVFDAFSIVVFTIEYMARVWCCTIKPEYRDPVRGRLRYILSPLALVDLAAILPFYLPLVLDLRFLRALRLLRLMLVFKIGRYSIAFSRIARVLKDKRGELVMISVIFAILLVFSASLMYIAENAAQPEVFSSIPASLWWAVITLTTVGYGDVVPITRAGRMLGGVIAILGIGLFALPAGIIASGLLEQKQARRREGQGKCPHCGGAL